MKVAENAVISFHFTLKDEEGNILDSTDGHDPEYALIGSGELVQGLEDALIGKVAGEKVSVSLEADMAYGDYQKSLEIDLKIEDFPDDPQIGEEYLLDADEMAIPFAVEKIDGDDVFLNGNHLFAGKEVHFDVEILNVRPATEEELEHGHVHHGDHDH